MAFTLLVMLICRGFDKKADIRRVALSKYPLRQVDLPEDGYVVYTDNDHVKKP